MEEPIHSAQIVLMDDFSELELSHGGVPLDQCPVNTYLGRLSKGSQRAMIGAIRKLAEIIKPGMDPYHIAWHKLRYQHTARVAAILKDMYAPKTANRHIAALRGVLDEACKLGLMTEEEYHKANRMQCVKEDPNAEPAGRALEKREVTKLVQVCEEDTQEGARDRCMLGLLFGGGLRRFEVAGAMFEKLSPNCDAITVIGKGNKTRTVPLPLDAAELVRRWILVRGKAKGTILYGFTPQGRLIYGRSISPAAIYNRLQILAQKAGLEPISPHDARRTRITQMFAEHQSLPHIQKIAGHAQSNTTTRYDRSQDAEIKASAQRVSMFDGEE